MPRQALSMVFSNLLTSWLELLLISSLMWLELVVNSSLIFHALLLNIVFCDLSRIKSAFFVVFKSRMNPYSIIATEMKKMHAINQISIAVNFEPVILFCKKCIDTHNLYGCLILVPYYWCKCMSYISGQLPVEIWTRRTTSCFVLVLSVNTVDILGKLAFLGIRFGLK